jgi:hypothetical protein
MHGYQSVHTAEHSPSAWQVGSSRLSTIAGYLVGYTVEDVERELILNSLEQFRGCRTYTANVLGISIRCLRNKIAQYAAEGIAVTPPGQRDNIDTDRHPPDCLSCGRPMRFARVDSRFSRSTELQAFQCGPCGLAVTADSHSFRQPNHSRLSPH